MNDKNSRRKVLQAAEDERAVMLCWSANAAMAMDAGTFAPTDLELVGM